MGTKRCNLYGFLLLTLEIQWKLSLTGISLVLKALILVLVMMFLFLFLILVTYVPVISTWLPTLVMGPEMIVK